MKVYNEYKSTTLYKGYSIDINLRIQLQDKTVGDYKVIEDIYDDINDDTHTHIISVSSGELYLFIPPIERVVKYDYVMDSIVEILNEYRAKIDTIHKNPGLDLMKTGYRFNLISSRIVD